MPLARDVRQLKVLVPGSKEFLEFPLVKRAQKSPQEHFDAIQKLVCEEVQPAGKRWSVRGQPWLGRSDVGRILEVAYFIPYEENTDIQLDCNDGCAILVLQDKATCQLGDNGVSGGMAAARATKKQRVKSEVRYVARCRRVSSGQFA